MKDPKVLKESGELQDYERRKILDSLLRVGVRAEDVDEIVRDIVRTVKPPLTTRKIFRATRKILRRYDPACTMKYSLKQAIYALGPSGYPFERYVARVLRERGYEVQVGQLIEGHCVVHEVDLLARKGGSCLMIECKFHHNRKTTSDVKTALYVHARFLDVLKAGKMCPGAAVRKGMLLTNTRFTSEALKYAECAGLRTMGWRHPEGEGLEQLIEQGRTYPVTILPGAKKAVFQALLGNGLVLARDILDTSEEKLVRLTRLGRDDVSRLKSHSAQLCGPL